MHYILDPLYYAVSWVLVQFHSFLGLLFGKSAHESIKWSLSIILLVVLIRVILIPLFVKQIKSQRALTASQPHMKEIQKRYKDDRQKQSEEMMKLYKEHKTNPLASCFPILAQAPIFFSLFTVLNGISKGKPHGFLKGEYLDSAAQATFFGAKISETFLGSPDLTVKIVTVLLIIFMSATTFTTYSTNFSGSGTNYVAYLFATLAGVSYVGSYTGTGTTQQINCGFTGGARFVMIKRTDNFGDWYVWDTARGMVSGTDPSLLLNTTAAEVNANSIYTTSVGFQIVSTASGINASGGNYIYLAIA